MTNLFIFPAILKISVLGQRCPMHPLDKRVGREGNPGRYIYSLIRQESLSLAVRKLLPDNAYAFWLFTFSAWRRTQDTKMKSTAYLQTSPLLVERLVVIWTIFIFYSCAVFTGFLHGHARMMQVSHSVIWFQNISIIVSKTVFWLVAQQADVRGYNGVLWLRWRSTSAEVKS